jgi:hypothetical protein
MLASGVGADAFLRVHDEGEEVVRGALGLFRVLQVVVLVPLQG